MTVTFDQRKLGYVTAHNRAMYQFFETMKHNGLTLIPTVHRNSGHVAYFNLVRVSL